MRWGWWAGGGAVLAGAGLWLMHRGIILPRLADKLGILAAGKGGGNPARPDGWAPPGPAGPLDDVLMGGWSKPAPPNPPAFQTPLRKGGVPTAAFGV